MPSDIAESIPNVRVADCPSVVHLFESKEKDKLVPLLEAERLTAWARPMRVGETPPVKVSGGIWRTHFLLFCPKTAGQFEQNQTFIKTNARQETVYFDLYLNEAQLQRVWPALQLNRA